MKVRLSSLLSLSFMGAPFQELLFQGLEIGNKILSFQKVLLQLYSTSTKSLKIPTYIDSLMTPFGNTSLHHNIRIEDLENGTVNPRTISN